MKNSLLPADTYTIINQTILTEVDKKIIISLYEPIIGPIAVSLYLTLWADLDKLEIMSKDFTHHHLMTILKTKLIDIENARKSLEAVGLLKSYIKRNDNINEYLYELYSPLSASEFLNHPVLSVLLLNNIGENEYNIILNNYKRHTFSKGDYEEITSSMNETFKSVNESVYEENIRSVKKLGVNIESSIDFELLESTLPKGLVTSKTFNKKTRDLINQLAFIYNIDSIKMSEIIRLVIDEYGIINKDKLRISTRKNYEYNNNGSLPTIVYRTQPEYLKSPSGDLSNRGKMIHVFENTKPYDFLKSKNRGIKPTSRDLKLLEHLAVDFDLPPGVINVLVDYALLVNNGKLNSAYLETIAGDWSRRNVKTVEDAMSIAEKGHKKNVKVVKEITKKDVVNVPAWMDKDNKSEKMSEEELAELESMFEEFR
ncbi:dNA replication protein DnaB [Firmicutes bacterium CAG:582]|nr:dNA replication protein DnaB [Firmicutes bacterium CAG:582]